MGQYSSGWLYDKVYGFKDYALEAQALRAVIERASPGAQTLLDVACGTGRHLAHLKDFYRAQGLDLSGELLAEARARNPGLPFHQADMCDFELGARFDAVVCLFSAIGHAGSVARLGAAAAGMARHLNPGGVLLIEPWFGPGQWHNGRPHAVLVDEPELKIARLNTSRQEGMESILDFHYLVATPQGVEHVREHLRLYLFSDAEYRGALEGAGLRAEHDPQGLTGRGLWIGKKA